MRPELEALARELVAASYLKGDFVLRSGKRSNVYFDKYLFETKPRSCACSAPTWPSCCRWRPR